VRASKQWASLRQQLHDHFDQWLDDLQAQLPEPETTLAQGSGGIESANKFICHTRLRRSGAWWYEINSNQMLALRCAKYNNTLDQVFVRHQERGHPHKPGQIAVDRVL